MVRAVKVQNTPSGSYSNLSIGVASLPVTIDYPYSESQSVNTIGNIVSANLYPNPASDVLNIGVTAQKAVIGRVTITNINGQSLYTKDVQLNSGINNIQISLERLVPGIYYTNITSGGTTTSLAWVKN